MNAEHRNGFSCGDMEDRVDDLERELGAAYMSLTRIHTWLGNSLHGSPERPPHRALVEDAYREAGEKVRP